MGRGIWWWIQRWCKPDIGSAVYVLDIENEGKLLKDIDITDQVNVQLCFWNSKEMQKQKLVLVSTGYNLTM